MELVTIYECLCDPTRLRILNLLTAGPLCVCHFQDVLGEPQVKISKHLAYLRARELVVATREGNWMIYSLPPKPPRELAANLACLQDCVQEDARLKRDLEKLNRRRATLEKDTPLCCGPKSAGDSPKKKTTRTPARSTL